MKNKLQYAYTISVFMGVLMTAYLMMNREGNARIPLRSLQGPSLKTEAVAMDPAVNQLFQMEDEMARVRKEKDQKRAPTTDAFPLEK